ncbi:hypothetical protein [Jatrophihabitans sp.]|uniref:hypothetical protein n=1 Tax=Jatrophihabitans sp. TaxID=1932789 RepID=UPI0030C6B43F|nr:hypothetical protein [Jatrophihabitans sp.]
MFGRKRERRGPVNQSTAPTIFDSDPRGTAWFLGLAAVGQSAINGTDGLVYVGDKGSAERTFNGDLHNSPQKFAGAAALALNGAAPPYRGVATFETERAGDFDNAPLRIYAARAVRQTKAREGLG